MKILSFDTTNNLASTAVLSNGQILSYNTTFTSSQQAEKLFSLIEESLIQAELTLDKIDLVSVTNGPGSFTGVRIGLAAALGMQAACKAKFIALTNFQVLAYFAKQFASSQEIAVVIDARRDQVYLQRFDSNLLSIDEPKLLNREDLNLANTAYVVSDGIIPLPILNQTNEFQDEDAQCRLLHEHSRDPQNSFVSLKMGNGIKVDAKLVALATEFYWQTNQYHDLIPLYIRQPDVTIKKP